MYFHISESAQVTFTVLQIWNCYSFIVKITWNTIRITAPRVTEITRCSDSIVAQGHAPLSSHETEITSAGLISPFLHNILVVQQHGWALIIGPALCIILIIKGYGRTVSTLHLARLNDWHLPSLYGLGEHGHAADSCQWWSDSFHVNEAWFHMACFFRNAPARVCAATPLQLTPLNQTQQIE